MKIPSLLALVVLMLLSILAIAVGGFLTSLSVSDWYLTLNKPAWNPPNWIFGPVWTTLYIMMAITAWLVWIEKDRPLVRSAMVAYGLQLFLNVCWSGMFFALENPLLGVIDIVLLWIALAWTLERFWKVKQVATFLMVPYFLWVTFAMVLNFTIWRLN